MNVNISKKVYNEIYFPYLYDDRELQIYYGGASSGKSVFIAQKIITEIMKFIGYNVMVLRAVAATNADSTFAELRKVINEWGLQKVFKVNKSLGRESITCINGNKIIFKGLDSEEKIKSTTFETGALTKIWIEEASEIKETDFNQLEIRLRGYTKIKKSIFISFNPVNIEHWIKKRFFDVKQNSEDCFILKTTYKDNRFLTEKDQKRIKKYKDIDYYYYEVYCLGEWGKISTARVFHNISIEDYNYSLDDLQNVCHGQDYGYIHANTIMTVGFRENCLYVYDEYYYKEHTNKKFIDKIKETDFDKHNLIVGDSASPAYIREWQEAGYNIEPAKKGKDSLENGINFLSNFKIIIHKSRCPNAAREFQGFKRRQLKDGTITEEFVEIDDDTIAGIRYATEHLWNDESIPVIKPSNISMAQMGL